MQSIKLVANTGDNGVGKTCLCITYTTNEFPSEYIPFVFDNFSANVLVDGRPINLGLWDITGREDFDRLRPLSYPGTDIFLLQFDIGKKSSLESIRTKWFPEIQHHCPNAPYILLGNKADVRDDLEEQARLREKGHKLVTFEEGKALAEEIKAAKYMECSAKTMTGVKKVFEEACRVVLRAPGPKKKKAGGCVFM